VPSHSDYGAELRRVYEACLPLLGSGRVATYIPELAHIDPMRFGLCLHTIDGETYAEGDVDLKISMQSISKVLVLAMVLPRVHPCFHRVGVEPSGDPFNSLVQLEFENGIPRNPFINAGALVVTDMLIELERDPKGAVLDYLASLCDTPGITFNQSVARSELATAARNRSLAYLMRSFGNIRANVEDLLDVYCHHCSIEMTLRELARSFSFLARGGYSASAGRHLLTPSETKRINSLMLTCGFYDESGEFAFRVGLPGKSGVGGAIITVLPGHFTLATWGPGLNEKGNSMLGRHALEMFTSNTGMSLF